MKVILLKDVPKVGQKNNIKEVKDGFALNLLLPRGLAQQATPGALKTLEKIKERQVLTKEADKERIAEKVAGLKDVVISSKANEKGHLFAGVGIAEIAKATGLPEESLVLSEPIKEVGDYDIEVSVGREKKVQFKLKIEEEK